MTDSRLTTLQRQHDASPGDLPTWIALLREQMRAGRLWEFECPCQVDQCAWCNRFTPRATGTFMCEKHYRCPCNGTGKRSQEFSAQFLAYCGHEAAREILGWEYQGLGGHEAGDVTRPVSVGFGGVAEGDLEAARGYAGTRGWSWHYLDAEQEEQNVPLALADWLNGLSCWGPKILTRAAIATAWRSAGVSTESKWLPWVGSSAQDLGERILAAAREAGEQPVRKAICAALISWVLGP